MGQVRAAGAFARDIVTVLKALRSRVMGDPGLAPGTTTSKIKIGTGVSYAIDGKVYTKAAADEIVVSGMTNTVAAQGCKVLVQVDAAGTVSFKQGPIDAVGDKYPIPDDSKTVLGYIDIPASFTFGTTAFTGGMFVDGGDPRLMPSAVMGGDSVGLES